MLPPCFQNVLKDMDIYEEDEKRILQRFILDEDELHEKITAYIEKLGYEEDVYERFITFLRIYQYPLHKLPNAYPMVHELIHTLQTSIDDEMIYRRLHYVLLSSFSITHTVIAVRHRDFIL